MAVLNKLTLSFLIGIFLLTLETGCKSKPKSTTPELVPQPVVVQQPIVVIDDIPADASASVRSHLIKLRELRDEGKITHEDYESRKAQLLRPR